MWNSLLQRFRRDPVQGTVFICVLTIHFAFILFILLSPSFAFHKKKHKPLIVKTVNVKSPTKTIAMEKKNPRTAQIQAPKAITPSPPPKKPEPLKKETPKAKLESLSTPVAVKKEVPKTVREIKKEPAIADKTLSKSKVPPVKKTPPPQNRAKISDSLLQQLEESIAKIDTKSDKGATNHRQPVSNKTFTPISLQIDNPISTDEDESDYTHALVNHLHRSLSLPDYGEVKIQLSLRQDGSVVKLVVLKTQSEKNKQYLESTLSRLKFPRFDGVYASKKEYTFILTFCNE